MVLASDSGILCENAVMAFNRYTISRSNLYSLCEVVCGRKDFFQREHKVDFSRQGQKYISRGGPKRQKFILPTRNLENDLLLKI